MRDHWNIKCGGAGAGIRRDNAHGVLSPIIRIIDG